MSTRWRWAWPGKEALLFQRLKREPIYQKLFAEAFPEQALACGNSIYSLATVTKALAAFQRTLLSFNSPYDRYKYGGQQGALSREAKRGEALFFGEKMECHHCHGSFLLTDNIKHKRSRFSKKAFTIPVCTTKTAKGPIPPDMKESPSSPAATRTWGSSAPRACATWRSRRPTCTTDRSILSKR